MSEKLLAIAALVTALANLGMFFVHCRRDKREWAKRPVKE